MLGSKRLMKMIQKMRRKRKMRTKMEKIKMPIIMEMLQ
jgi:hypothetical protein